MANIFRALDPPALKDVYLELEPDNTLRRMAVTDAGGIRRGDLQRFLGESVRDAMQKPFVPDNIILHYERVHAEDIPPRQDLFGQDRAPLMGFIIRHGTSDEDMIALRKAAYLSFHGEAITFDSLATVGQGELYRQFAAHEEALDKFLRGLPARMMLTIAETGRSIVVFSDSLRGRKAQTDYLQHMADTFFAVENEGVEHLRLFRFETSSRQLIELSDTCCRVDPQGVCLYDFSPAVNPLPILFHGREPMATFDMRPYGLNLDTFLSRTGMHLSRKNNDILTLQDIVRDGYQIAEMGACSYRDEFRAIDRALDDLQRQKRGFSHQAFLERYNRIQDDAKAIAGQILHERIGIRRPEPAGELQSRLARQHTPAGASEREPAVTHSHKKAPRTRSLKPKL